MAPIRAAAAFVVSLAMLVIGVPAAHADNSPWYPSLQAFEHYDSARSHVFSDARFGGSMTRPNKVDLLSSANGAYPSGYNMAYLNANAAFIQGGSYGDVENSIGPFVAKVNPKTLKPIWFTQLRNTVEANEWDYPGGMAIESDGYIYTVSGYRIYKVDSATGAVAQTLVLPTMVHMRNNYPNLPATYDANLVDNAANTSYNGINALSDGTIVVKSLYRVAGCTDNGPGGVMSCRDSGNVPASQLITVDPKTMSIIDNITLPAPAGARPTITRFNGVDYVYLVERVSNVVRYAVTNGKFALDTSWTPVAVPFDGQSASASVMVMHNWIVGATNSIPAAGKLTMYAIDQADATKIHYLRPYLDDPVSPVLTKAFATAANGAQAVSWAGMSLESDQENNLIFGTDTLSRKIGAYRISDTGFTTVWKKDQTTTEWATLIGSKDRRVWVGTDIPRSEVPGHNKSDFVVFRDAATGRLLASSKRVGQMTQGSAVQPGYGGSVFFPVATGTLIKMTPRPAGESRKAL